MPAYLMVFEREVPGFAPSMDGSALSRASALLDALAKNANVTPLMEFFSAPPEFVEEFAAGHGLDPDAEGSSVPDEKWFSADQGLLTVHALQSRLSSLDAKVRSAVERDLNDFANGLETARALGIRWHLAIDF